MIVIGVDGMDPGFVERHWPDLPNLDRMRRRGGFTRLATTTPPQSPVAWSTFITGLDPDAHGIYDFVHRDPSTMMPFLSTDRTEPPRLSLPLGPYELPLSGSRVISLRRGKAFWQILEERRIPVTIVRMPTDYPPLSGGQSLAGMGTPDLRGTLGTFQFYSSDPDEVARTVSGGIIAKIAPVGGHALLTVEGPPNTLRKDQRESSINLVVDIDPQEPVARVSAGGTEIIIRQGEWSGWLAADFPLIPHLASTRGMFRIFAKQLHPQLELYVSPINVDPEAPALPISSPGSFSRRVAGEIGRFSTLGIPEDTSALRQGVFDLPEFLSQTHMILDGERKLLSNALSHFDGGFVFFYFSAVDQNSHMLWGKHDAELLTVYREVDASVGEVMQRQPDAELMVMSDHGFAAFDRAVNLNTWLENRGLLTRRGNEIDWPRTKAYALGLNGLYLNVSGREKQGVVSPADRSALIESIRAQLAAFRDPSNGAAVVEVAQATHPSAANRRIAPDLIVGYRPGYRASWQTALGEVGDSEIEDNNDAWIADHCIDAAAVPGVLFTSRAVSLGDPGLRDLPVSILAFFGIDRPADWPGRRVY
jgi:predicted AlkP superfamily phosphohydrolase/phosphomutase